MPFGDRTGPRGQGPFTGRGAGYGSGFPGPGFMNPSVAPRGGGGVWVVGEDDKEVRGPLGLWNFPVLNGLLGGD